MTTKTMFEDRLLAELQGEIALREADAARAAEVAAEPAPNRRVFTPRRLAFAGVGCAAAALAVVLAPGSPAQSTAYAVERHSDGSVTLTLEDIAISRDAQQELAERLRADGIHVDIQNLDGDHKCRRPRGESLPGNFDGESASAGGAELASRLDAWKVTLHRDDTLAFENHDLGSEHVRAVNFYAVKGAIEPCVQVERPNPLEGVTTHSSKG